MAWRMALVVGGLAVSLGAGCGAPQRAPDARGGPEIGLMRGHSWSTLTVKPPHIVGPNANMILRDSVLSGSIGGVKPDGAPRGGYLRVRIAKDGAEGHAPVGPVSLTFKIGATDLDVEGMWNGARVHLVFAEDSLRGTVAHQSGPLDATIFSPSTSPDRAGPLPDAHCQYVLTERGSDGALSGISTCAGMPERTRLEVPHSIQAWMTRSELVVVLVALLAAPPLVSSEAIPFAMQSAR